MKDEKTKNGNGISASNNEALINGIRVKYDACSSNRLPLAIAYYEEVGMEYIGSGFSIWIDGVKQADTKDKYHFFRHKTNQDE